MLILVIRRWRERRRQRRIERQERKTVARETLRDFKPSSRQQSGWPPA